MLAAAVTHKLHHHLLQIGRSTLLLSQLLLFYRPKCWCVRWFDLLFLYRPLRNFLSSFEINCQLSIMECNGSSKAAEEDNAELSLQNSSNSVNNAVTSVDTNVEFLKTAVSDESSADNNNQQSTKKRKTAAVRRRSSRIWDHFEVVESSTSRTGYYVTCQHCNWRILYSRGSGSSGCNKHMSSTSCPYFSKITTVVIEGETSFGQSSPVMASSNKGVNSPSPSKGQTQNSGDSDIIRVAVIQMSCSSDKQKNIDKAISMVRTAAEQGAQVVLLQELFEGEYFCQEQSSEYFAWAHEVNLNLDGESVKSSLLCSPGAGAHTVPASGNTVLLCIIL